MNDFETGSPLDNTAQRLAELGRRVDIDLQHKARLREELMRRHQELSAESTQRAADTLWPRFPRLKRLTLVAPAALAAAVALSLLLWSLQIAGHQAPRVAEAARITQALAKTVPTVTAWNATVHQEGKDSASSFQCRFGPVQRLYLRDGRTYLFSGGHWYWVTVGRSAAPCSGDLQWAFAMLASHYVQRNMVAEGQVIDGQSTDVIRYVVVEKSVTRVVSTAWVNRQNGLVVRLERVESVAGKVVESESVDYRYNYQRTP